MGTILSNSYIQNLKYDLPSALVVFFVAIPLCLGISLASGAPLLSGLIAGTMGGIVVGWLSGSPLSVSGPAAGLTSIVLSSIKDLGSFEGFLAALFLAGFLQIIMGFLKAGVIGHYFPYSVIKGMLAGIGLILVLKQIPHAFGNDTDYEGDQSFLQPDNQNTLTEIIVSISNYSIGAILVAGICLAVLIGWNTPTLKKFKLTQIIPGPLVVIFVGVLTQLALVSYAPNFALAKEHLVDLPSIDSIGSVLTFPDWSVFANLKLYYIAFTIALVASLETLLNIEASDKMDPFKRITPLNKELKAQGCANALCGLIGGLPVTSVIVRTSTNATFGARTKMSTILHGILIAISVIIFPTLLEYIPLASLAAILIVVGYKLTSPALWGDMYRKGSDQFYPFVVTVVGIVFTNLLVGIFIGMMVALFFVLRSNFHSAILCVNKGSNYMIKFTKDASFLNKSSLVKTLEHIPTNSNVLFEGTNVQFFDNDIIEVINDFKMSSTTKNIKVEVKKTTHALHPFFQTIIN